MQWGSWSTLSETADPWPLGQVSTQLREPRMPSGDTEHLRAVDPLSSCAAAETNHLYLSGPLQGAGCHCPLALWFPFLSRLQLDSWNNRRGWPGSLSPWTGSCVHFLIHDVMKTWGTLLQSQNLISNTILIIVITKKKNQQNPHDLHNPYHLVANFIKPRCPVGIQSMHEQNGTWGWPYTFLLSPFLWAEILSPVPQGRRSLLSLSTLRPHEFCLLMVGAQSLTPSHPQYFFGLTCSL